MNALATRTATAAASTRAAVEGIVGPVSLWVEEPNAVSFRPTGVITFRQLGALAALFGTDEIDVFTGRADEDDAEAGEITVMKPFGPAAGLHDSGVFLAR